jgi:aminopeptidase YwaD
MKRLNIFLIFLILSSVSYSQDIEYAKFVVKKLASPELQGRGYTEKGNLLAAEYISSEYKRIGLVPFGKSYYQKFHIPINTFPNEISLKINGETLKPAIDYLIESSSPGIKGKYNIVKSNRKGIDTEEKLIGLINKAGDNFILIDNTEKFTDDKELNKKIDDYISYLKYSPQIPCKGIIIFTKEKLNWENSTFQNSRPIVIINKDIDINSFNSIELIIENKFIKNYETQNIIGYIKGGLYPDSFIVITAHYDHLGKMGKQTYFPGANDNASGVAMILALANYYAKNQPNYSIVVISLSAEEVGILGAKEFTENPLIKLNRIKFLINFDLAGTGEEGIKIVNGSIYKDKFDLLTKINTENNLLPKIDIRGAACNSDHCLFYQKGVPCFYIYTQGGIQAYHDIYDKYETLPLTEFVDYCTLMIKFFDAI